jgi:aflatoxin B1 aldehyde reductase
MLLGVEQTRVHNLEDVGTMLDVFQSHGHNRIDTARVYGQGSSEEYLGELKWQDRGITMDTKLYPTAGRSTAVPQISHSPSDLRKFLLQSLSALKTKKVDMWYLHAPDRTTPFENTLRAVDELHKEGLFDQFGLSNFMSWEVAQINEICIRNGWIRPSVYQGVYNAIHRSIEAELFPCLRHYSMGFFAFNPLAGGYLTSRYHREPTRDGVEKTSRFDPSTVQGKRYRARYWNDTMFDALDIIRSTIGKYQLTEAECALRWIMHHSQLRAESGDAVIVGASSINHLKENLDDMEKGPLPEEVLQALDKAWEISKGVVWNYYH